LKRALLVSLTLLALQAAGEPQRRFIVQFRASVLPSASQFREDFARIETAPASPAEPGPRIRYEYSRLFHGASVEVNGREALAALAALSYVAAVHPDLEVEAYGRPGPLAVPASSVRVNASGSGVVVAIIDSGVDYTHPALGGGMGPGRRVIGGYDFVNGDDDPKDDNRHGTHVAGIVAANSATLSGLAPDVSLLVYKVLDAAGKGRQSDVIAALERAIDPNGDGDPSDRADVANLSLGAPGNPLDPVAQAVERAVAAGMVVCAAAGNDGIYHAIGSPAVAASAIAVGAAANDGTLAEFSNRGPSARSGAIKPDVLAPGVSITSTAMGGGTLVLSGTSMASPYVAGLAALLIEQHPSWSPAQIKAAIVNSALPIVGEEVMSQGAGRVDRTGALQAVTLATPTQLNFELMDLSLDRWTAARTIQVTNGGTSARRFAISASGGTGAITINAPPAIDLEAGETKALTVTLSVDRAQLPASPTPSFAFGGLVTLTDPVETLRVPWAFLKAARAIVTYDLEFPQIAWSGPGLAGASFAFLDARSVETLLAPGTYDLILTSAWQGDLRLIVAENQRIDGNVTIARTAADATHAITLDARDANGVPLPGSSGDDALYAPTARLLITHPAEASLDLGSMSGKTLHTSSMSSRFGLLFTENFVDGPSRTMYVAQHPPLAGVSGSRTLTIGAAEYEAKLVLLRFPAGSTRRDVGMLPRGMVRRPDENAGVPSGVLTQTAGDEWTGTLYLTPEVHPDFFSGAQFFLYSGHAASQGLASTITPVLRRTASGFLGTRRFESSAVTTVLAAGEDFDFRNGDAAYPQVTMAAIPQGWNGELGLYGQREDAQQLRLRSSTWRVRDARGTIVASGAPGIGAQWFVSLPQPDSYTATIEGGAFTTSIGFDTRGDGRAPAMTSLAIFDESGARTSHIAVKRGGSLVFSIKDTNETRTRVFWRRRTASTWVELGLTMTGEDAAIGRIYRGDLADISARAGEIVLVFESTDADGNTLSHTVEPAFRVEPGTSRRRAARH
jgi:subtilisin family serine protease